MSKAFGREQKIAELAREKLSLLELGAAQGQPGCGSPETRRALARDQAEYATLLEELDDKDRFHEQGPFPMVPGEHDLQWLLAQLRAKVGANDDKETARASFRDDVELALGIDLR